MKKIMLLASLFSATILTAQTVTPKVSFVKGQVLEQNSEVKVNMVQELMGQAIDVNIATSTKTHFEVKSASSDSFSITNTLKRVTMHVSGAGQEQQFDSDKKEDLDGKMGTVFKNRIGKAKELTVNNQGMITAVKDSIKNTDDAMGMMGMMSSPLSEPDEKAGTHFRTLANIPSKGVKVGDSWTDSIGDSKNKTLTRYTLKSVTGNQGVVSLAGNIEVDQEIEQGSMAMHMAMKGVSEGEYSFDLVSGIISSMRSTTKSTGTMEVMGQSLPIKMEATMLTTVAKK